MAQQSINVDIMEYMVWVIEIVASEFFKDDKTVAYSTLMASKLWDIYVNHYDTTHTLSREYLIDEVREYFTNHGVKI